VDHRLVYERRDQTLGEGRYRLRLVVSGDRLTEVTYFIRIPEAFTRRYEQMRSANNAIGVGSTIGVLVLYGVGGIAVGLFVLLRYRWVVWRSPVLWGFGIALVQVLDLLNQWPLMWMGYDTALSTGAYVARQLAVLGAAFVGLGVMFSLSFMAAESLTRRAFPSHPQFWRSWSRPARPSIQILGRTVAGILLVSLFFAYDAVLYFFATRVLGWWTPSEALFHPDVLATYFPWFSALAPSLQAGFWEECLFRAVPIAGAALIGDRIGQRRLMIILAFIVQSIVFGAGHAPYPTQPAYARAVELIVPSIAFGLIYLWFGLLPGIVLHFLFDAVWFALPLFVSSAPGVWIDQTLVVVLALIPLWIVVFARVRESRWTELPDELRNGAWRPPEPSLARVATEDDRGVDMPQWVRRALPALGIVAVIAWALVTPWRSEIPGIQIDSDTARETARRAVTEAGAQIDSTWRIMPVVRDGRDESHAFVLETAGRDVYMRLLGSYLSPPHWIVRVARFEGDVAERAEEWTAVLESSGSVRMVRHTLPEGRPGTSLGDDQARALAYAFIQERYGLAGPQVREVSMQPSRLAARTDWEATFADLDPHGLKQGELRIAVSIAGDRVSGARRFVYVPEDWERRHRNEATAALVTGIVGGLALVALLVGEAIVAVVSWSRRAFAVRLFLGFLGLQIVMRALTAINQWPSVTSAFSTAQPYRLQRVIAAVALAVGVLVPSAVLALIIGAAPIAVRRTHLRRREMLAIGASLGAIAAALLAFGRQLGSARGPAWPAIENADAVVPAAGEALSMLSTYLLWTVGVLVVVMATDQVTRSWRRWRIPVALLIVLIGLSVGALAASGPLLAWLATGLIIGILMLVSYVVVLRYDPALLPIATAVLVLTSAIRLIPLRSFPGAAFGAGAGVLLTLGIGWWWGRALSDTRMTTGDEAAVRI
jgi:hypothetical protein